MANFNTICNTNNVFATMLLICPLFLCCHHNQHYIWSNNTTNIHIIQMWMYIPIFRLPTQSFTRFLIVILHRSIHLLYHNTFQIPPSYPLQSIHLVLPQYAVTNHNSQLINQQSNEMMRFVSCANNQIEILYLILGQRRDKLTRFESSNLRILTTRCKV